MQKIVISLFLLCSFSQLAISAETDNFSLENFNQPEVSEPINAYFNQAIDSVIRDWNPKWGADKNKFVKKVYLKLKGNLISDRFTRWANKNLPVLKVKKKDSIYAEVNLSVAPIFAIFGVGNSVNIQGVSVGLDKVSHFLGAGYIMWKRNFKEGKGLQDALDWAENTESRFLGQGITGVYSNGDLVADYEGMLFFQSLLNENLIPGKSALVKFEGNQIVKLREFDLLDHFTPFWSEAVLPSSFKKKVKSIVLKSIPLRCPIYHAHPSFYQISEDLRTSLNQRYSMLKLLFSDQLLMQNICE